MVQHERGNGKFVWSSWHRRRQEARETAMSEEEFSEQEQNAFDLDTAGITGEDNPETYTREEYFGDPWWRD